MFEAFVPLLLERFKISEKRNTLVLEEKRNTQPYLSEKAGKAAVQISVNRVELI